MKKQIQLLVLAPPLGFTAQAATFSFGANNLFATIPDGDLNGYQNTLTLSALPGYLTDVNLTLNLSGGFNGDLYAFVSHNNSTAILLNRVGRGSTSNAGYPDTGFGPDVATNAFTFDNQASYDVHFYRNFPYSVNGSGQVTGVWQPDKRTLDPLSSAALFDAAARSSLLDVFNGMEPNGDWTIFLADVSSTGESTLVSWGLQLTIVPEPASIVVMFWALAGGLLWTWRRGASQTKS